MSDASATDSRPAAPQLFISYASADLDRAAALHARLEAAGFVVWFDKARLRPGCDWHREIEAGCEAARVVLPLLTPRWKASEWTRFETYGHAAILPLRAEGAPQDILTPPLKAKQGLAFDPLAADDAAWQALFAALRDLLAAPVPERAPRLVELPYPANPFFTGRDADLVRIHEELHEAPVAALVQGRVRVLAAMGGIGKTTLANEYARRFWRLYPQILWIDARRGYRSEFALLFDRLFPERAGADLKPEEKAARALAELDGRRERLLVIDNVEDAGSVRPWLPRRATTGCRTLITSRFADWPQAAGIRAVALDLLEPEPSRDFLVARTGRAAEGAELAACDALARELGYLPLALEQAAAYIAAPGQGIGFADYLRLYRAAAAELLARGVLGSTEYPDAVVTTWQATVAKLSPESRAVLRLCAWLADTPIPRGLVLEGAAEVLALAAAFGPVAPPEGAGAAELRMRDALAGLARYSMVLDGTDASFRVHGLVQGVERLRAAAEGAAAAARSHALARLAGAFPDAFNDPSRWPLCRMLLPHQRVLTERLGEDDGSPNHARLLELTGMFLQGSGDAAAALPLYRRALEGSERVLGAEHPATLRGVNNLAQCLQALGDAAAALPLLRRALEGRERALGAEHPATLTSVNNLALCLQEVGDAAAALPLHRRALEGSERALGAEHPQTLTSVNNLAQCLQEVGEAAAALPLYRRALEGSERALGAEHPDTLGSVDNLAGCLDALGEAAAALPLHRRALQGRERVLGAEHPQTLLSVANLAHCLQALGEAAAALPLYRRALQGRERVLGAEHPQTLDSVNSLAGCLDALGEAAAALPLHRRAVQGSERVLGAEHPQTLDSVNSLAGCLYELGDAAAALPLYRRALEGSERVLGAEHPATLRGVNNLAQCLQEVGEAAAALPLLRRAVQGSERVLGAEHPQTLTSVNNLALCLQEVGEAAAALPLLRRAVQGRERALGAEHPQTLTSVNNLAQCLQEVGEAAAALPLLRRAVQGSERALGAEHPHTLNSVANLAGCLDALGEAAAALPLHRRALQGRERVLGAEHPDTLLSVANLAHCLQALGEAAAALPLHRRAVQDSERVLGAEHPHTRQFRANLAQATRSSKPWWRRLSG